MTIIPRNGRYGVRIYVRGRSTWLGTFDDEDEAKLAEIKAKRARVRRQETVQEFADRYIEDFNKATRSGADRWGKKTRQDMRYALRAFTTVFGPFRLRDLDVTDIRPWAASTPFKYVAVARTLMSDAVRDGLAERNPFSQLRLEHSRGRKDLIVMSEAEAEETIDLAERLAGPTVAALIATACYAGPRPGELFALEPGDVDLQANELHIRQSFNGIELKAPKNGRTRRIVLPPQAAARISSMPRSLHSRWLFTTAQHRQFRRESLHRVWNPIRCTIDRPSMAFYEWRHTAATFLLQRGLSPELVAFQLGHTDGGKLVRELYGHPEDAWQREQIKRAFREVAPLQVAEKREVADG